jgi:hypothetical protein
VIAFDTNVLVRIRTSYTFDGKLKNREGFTYLR